MSSLSLTAILTRRDLARPSASQVALWLGIAAIGVPTLVENLHQSWSLEQGEQGPIVLGIGLWLLYRCWPAMRAVAAPGSVGVSGLLGGISALLYLLGRIDNQFLFESYGAYGFMITGLYSTLGWRSLRTAWFALFYLFLALPVPFVVTWALTSHLRLWVTEAVVQVFQAAGFDIVRDGLVLMVDQYELAVQDACSGMNSLFSLSAIGLIYVYLRRGERWSYIVAMIPAIVVIAIFGNFVRVSVLVLLTHYFGDSVAQGFLHETTGLLTFVVALGGVMLLDAVIGPREKKKPTP